jgi:hypothetical protein
VLHHRCPQNVFLPKPRTRRRFVRRWDAASFLLLRFFFFFFFFFARFFSSASVDARVERIVMTPIKKMDLFIFIKKNNVEENIAHKKTRQKNNSTFWVL